MADSKISALAGATTPLAGTEVLPIVQSGTTKQVAISDLTSGRIVNMSQATVGSTSAPLYGSKLFVDGGIETASSQFNILSGTSTPYEFVNRSAIAGFDFYVASASKRSVRFLDNGNVSITDNLIQGTAAKGINFTANTPAAGMTSQLLNWYEEGTWTPNQGAGLTVVGAFSSSGTYTRIGRQVTVRGQMVGATSVAVVAAGVMSSNLPYVASVSHAGSMFNSAVTTSGVVQITSSSVVAATTIAATPNITFTATYTV